MSQLRKVDDNSIAMTSPEERKSKSWVANRFLLVHERGVSRRRCRSQDCNKEYSRTTSHMILKNHWQKAHNEQFDSTHDVGEREAGDRASIKKPKKEPKTPTKGGKNDMVFMASGGKGIFDVKSVSKRLREAASIHLTYDIHKKGSKTYGIITAHSIPLDSHEVKLVLLEYKHLTAPEETAIIVDTLRQCILQFNIREKIVSISSTHAATMQAAMLEIDKRNKLSKNFHFNALHIPCFPFWVHSNVIDVFKSQDDLLDRARKIVTFINSNNITLTPMTNGDSPTKATGLKLPQDTKNSWGTTYVMIESLIQQRTYVEPAILCVQNQSDDPEDLSIEWDRLFALQHLLKPFYDAINSFVRENCAPASIVVALIPHLMSHLSGPAYVYEDLFIAAHNIKCQLETYQDSFKNELTTVCGLLDPRIKDAFMTQEGREVAVEVLRRHLNSVSQEKYEPYFPADSVTAAALAPRHHDEILAYLEAPRLDGNIDLVLFWECEKKAYPNLYTLAKTVTCVQATSVPNDRMFSAAENYDRGRVMSEGSNNKELRKSWQNFFKK